MFRRLFLIVAIPLSAWAFGLVLFTMSIPRPTDTPAPAAQAVVVLTGGSERLQTGLELLRTGMADKLLISGVNPSVRLNDLLSEEKSDWSALRGKITLGHAAADTLGNAYETANWASKEGITSLTLVTAAYHMPRALLELSFVMPNATIHPHPVFPPSVKHDTWWRWPGTASLVSREYTKYLLAHLRRWLQGFAD